MSNNATRRIWTFVSDNLLPLVTVSVGALALGLYSLNLIGTNAILGVILGLVCLLATTEIVERSKRFDRLEGKLEHGLERVITALNGVEAEILDREELYQHLSSRVLTAQTIDIVNYEPYGTVSGGLEERRYVAAIDEMVQANRIRFRLLTTAYSTRDVAAIRTNLERYADKRYYIAYQPPPLETTPVLNFLIVDQAEVYMTFFQRPYGEEQRYVYIKHPKIAKAYNDHYELRWREATKLNERGIQYDILDQIQASFEGDPPSIP